MGSLEIFRRVSASGQRVAVFTISGRRQQLWREGRVGITNLGSNDQVGCNHNYLSTPSCLFLKRLRQPSFTFRSWVSARSEVLSTRVTSPSTTSECDPDSVRTANRHDDVTPVMHTMMTSSSSSHAIIAQPRSRPEFAHAFTTPCNTSICFPYLTARFDLIFQGFLLCLCNLFCSHIRF